MMRLLAVLWACATLGGCATTPPPQSEQALVRDSSWRQHQAELDAQAIMAGMARAQAAAQVAARTAR